jgi:hypothetical protein
MENGKCYAHVFNCKGFPIHIENINKDLCYEYVNRLLLGISFGFLHDNYLEADTIEDDNFYVFIDKNLMIC